MAQQPATIEIKNPIKEGWLQKQSRHFRRWRRRWIVLEGSKLYSFKNERKYENPTEIIDLKIFSSVKSSEDQTHKQYSFDVYSPEMRFSMVAGTENEKEDWIRHIGKAIVMSNQKVCYHTHTRVFLSFSFFVFFFLLDVQCFVIVFLNLMFFFLFFSVFRISKKMLILLMTMRTTTRMIIS